MHEPCFQFWQLKPCLHQLQVFSSEAPATRQPQRRLQKHTQASEDGQATLSVSEHAAFLERQVRQRSRIGGFGLVEPAKMIFSSKLKMLIQLSRTCLVQGCMPAKTVYRLLSQAHCQQACPRSMQCGRAYLKVADDVRALARVVAQPVIGVISDILAVRRDQLVRPLQGFGRADPLCSSDPGLRSQSLPALKGRPSEARQAAVTVQHIQFQSEPI